MTGRKKIYFLLNAIDDAMELAPSGAPTLIHPTRDLNKHYSEVELMQILSKFADSKKILKIVKIPSDKSILKHPYIDLDIGCYALEILTPFKDFLAKTKQESGYKAFVGKGEKKKTPDKNIRDTSTEIEHNNNVIYKVTYSRTTRKILINSFLLKQPQSFGDNEAIFSYLYENANQDKTVEDIKEATGLNSVKSLSKFVEGIGFTGNKRKIFFVVSKTKIRFNNPITRDNLKDWGIEFLSLK